MKQKNRQFTISFVLGALIIGVSAGPASVRAEEKVQPPTRYIVPESVALRESAGGQLIGTLKRGSPVLELETREDWVHIAAEAWVRKSELAARSSSVKVDVAKESLKVAEFTLKPVEKEKKDEESKILLKLLVQNSSPQDISTWTGILLIEDPQGKAIVRTPIEGGPVKSGASADFNFFWASSEDAYAPLSRYAADSSRLNVALTNVKFK